MFFRVTANTGEVFEVASYVDDFMFESPSVAVISEGAFLTENANRDPIEWPAFPERAEGGMVFPGIYRITSTMPGSVYSCVCFLPQQILALDTSMYQLEHLYLNLGEALELSHAEGFRAVIVVSGKVATADGLKTRGQRADVPAGLTLQATAMEAAHVVCYRLKDQSNG